MKQNDKLIVVKIGGNVIDNEQDLKAFLLAFSKIENKKILVHGGGKLATQLADKLGIEQKMIDGRRITDDETLKITTMVYAGLINKNIVAQLQSLGNNAIGLTGADANVILAHKRIVKEIDYGFVGDVDEINHTFLSNLLEENITPVIAPITHNGKGDLLNTNADTIAQSIATSLSISYETSLIYCFEKNGVLKDIEDEDDVIPEINPNNFENLKNEKIIHSGMLPKIENSLAGVENGILQVVIGNWKKLKELTEGISGTKIIAN